MHREAGMSEQRLTISPLTAEAFAAFGDVIESEGRAHHPINAGSAQRFDDLACVLFPSWRAIGTHTVNQRGGKHAGPL